MPEEKVRWLLRFVQLDLAAASDADWETVHEGLFRLIRPRSVGYGHPPSDRARRQMSATHEELRRCFTELAVGRKYYYTAPSIMWSFAPPASRPAGARTSDPITRANELEVGTNYDASLVFLVIDLLNSIGADRLKACSYRRSAEESTCGRIFIAQRRQKFCSAEHAQKAAWRAYLQRGGDIERKRTR